MNVIFHYDCGPWLEDRLAALSADGLDVRSCPEADEARFQQQMADAAVLWHVLKPVTAHHINAAPNLRLIQKIGVGVNTIDLEAARANGVAVCNMPGTNSRAVAEMTLALMLACLRRVAMFDARTRTGRGWNWPTELQCSLGEIGGRTIGLVGFGAVPRLLAPVLTAMGADIIYTARSEHPESGLAFHNKADLLARSDILSLHIPQTTETEGWLDDQAIAAMKPGAILINTARGGLVDEGALVTALKTGRIAAAGLDVFDQEPVAAAAPLMDLDNVVATPHIAWFTRETLERSLSVAAENCRRLRDGQDLLYRVV